MKKYVSNEPDESEVSNRSFVTKTKTEVYGVGDYYVQSYAGTYVGRATLQPATGLYLFTLTDILIPPGQVIDVVVPPYITSYVDASSGEIITGSFVVANISFNNLTFTAKDKIRSFIVEQSPLGSTVAFTKGNFYGFGIFENDNTLEYFELPLDTKVPNSNEFLNYAFKGSKKLKKILVKGITIDSTYANRVTLNYFIQKSAVEEVRIYITSVTFKDSPQEPYATFYAYEGCEAAGKLKHFELTNPKPLISATSYGFEYGQGYHFDNYCFRSCVSLKTLSLDGITDKHQLRLDGLETFFNTPNLEISEFIGHSMSLSKTFYNMAKLEKLTVYAQQNTSSRMIAMNTIAALANLKELKITGYTALAANAIHSCATLHTVHMLSTLCLNFNTNFNNAPMLKHFYIENIIPPLRSAPYIGTTVKANITFYIPIGTTADYEASPSWTEFTGQFVEYDFS